MTATEEQIARACVAYCRALGVDWNSPESLGEQVGQNEVRRAMRDALMAAALPPASGDDDHRSDMYDAYTKGVIDGRAKGRAEALEEAAKLAENDDFGQFIANAIRALARAPEQAERFRDVEHMVGASSAPDAAPDWPPQDSASFYLDGSRKHGSTGQLFEARHGQWVRVSPSDPNAYVAPPPDAAQHTEGSGEECPACLADAYAAGRAQGLADAAQQEARYHEVIELAEDAWNTWPGIFDGKVLGSWFENKFRKMATAASAALREEGASSAPDAAQRAGDDEARQLYVRVIARAGQRATRYREALKAAQIALNDWLVTYAEDNCSDAAREETGKRITALGTIGYIASVQEQISAALREEG